MYVYARWDDAGHNTLFVLDYEGNGSTLPVAQKTAQVIINGDEENGARPLVIHEYDPLLNLSVMAQLGQSEMGVDGAIGVQGLRKSEAESIYGEQAVTNAEARAVWVGVRQKRDNLLSLCDWTQLGDAPIREDVRNSWNIYRQKLRDVTNDFSSPAEVVWPTPPNQQ